MIHLTGSSSFKNSDLPLDPGVYLFRDVDGNLLYIGKAKKLRSRVRSYFISSTSSHYQWATNLIKKWLKLNTKD